MKCEPPKTKTIFPTSPLRILGFNYDGAGPDAFLLAGTRDAAPSHRGDVVLPVPFRLVFLF